MKVNRETVLGWLAKHKRSRDWLAEMCGVGAPAVSNWLREKNPRPIPSKVVLIIGRLMEADLARAAEKAEVPQNLVLEFPNDVFDLICDAALKAGQKPKEWVESKLQNLAEMDMRELSEEIRRDPAYYDFTPKIQIVAESTGKEEEDTKNISKDNL